MDEQQRNIADVASSSKPSSAKKYDVFLSFRGEDTRLNFTSHLYKALVEARIETFIDNRLKMGDEISDTLIKAIEDSRISIVIFSKNYASSRWCLDELNKIMESKEEKGQIVIPVFYHIDPSDVRHQTGRYKEHLDKYEGHPMLGKWKAALTKAANLSGQHHNIYCNHESQETKAEKHHGKESCCKQHEPQETNAKTHSTEIRPEAEVIKNIVQGVLKILKELAPTDTNQRKRYVGIEKSREEVESLLNIGSNAVIILGIWGMGGIGKTTLAKALYDKLHYDFEGRCFLADIKGKSDKLTSLCNELFSTLLGKKKKQFDSVDMRRLRLKKVLIVLDDVSTTEQLEKLIEEYDFLGAGSKVIITTRDKQVLSKANETYEVEELNSQDSIQLFCLTAFGENQPKQGYENLSTRVISYCKGLPLALKVLGASLRNKSEEVWEDELRKLQKIPDAKIHDALKLSYEGLEGEDEKKIFLDIACFFKGEKRDRVIEILESFGFFPKRGIDLLVSKALITISDANKIEMHDLIQEMGREIVKKCEKCEKCEKCPENRSRLWKHEEVFDVLKKNKGTEKVEGIILDLSKLTKNLNLSSSFLANMPNCRFLKIYKELLSHDNEFNVYLQDGLTSLSQNLRYVHWDACSLKSWPPNFCCAEQLVELHIQFRYAKKLWDGVQNLTNLKSIDLSDSTELVEIPDLSKAEKLEKVSLSGCFELHQLHPSTLSLPKLTYLNLGWCSKIESLESNVHLKSLQELILERCERLKKFSVRSDAIKVLDLTETSISSLSLSAGHLLSLEVLKLSGTNIERLPENRKNLSMLGVFQVKECQKVVSLPQLPSSLIELHLNKYEELEHLPELPPSLKELHLYGCKKLKHLPPELPSSLIKLDLSGCWELVSLPQLPLLLEELCLDDCLKLESLPKLPLSLIEISLYGCCELESLPELPRLLTGLPLNNCKKLMSLPPELPSNLTALLLNDCQELEFLPKLPLSMRVLDLKNCLKLISLPKLPSSVELVSTFNCKSLDTVITEGLVLEHMCQSRIPDLHEQYLNNPKFDDFDYFIFPIDHITNKSGFHTAESSLTIPDLPKSGLWGFICYIIFYNERELDVSDDDISDEFLGDNDGKRVEYDEDELELHVSINIYQDGKQIRRKLMWIECPINLISDHVLFSYLDICRFDGISEVCDQFSNITFKFELGDWRLEERQARIKGCGVFPVYDTTSGLKLFNSSTKAGHDQEIGVLQDSQISNNEAQASTTEVECSNDENEDGWEQQLLPAFKRLRISP